VAYQDADSGIYANPEHLMLWNKYCTTCSMFSAQTYVASILAMQDLKKIWLCQYEETDSRQSSFLKKDCF